VFFLECLPLFSVLAAAVETAVHIVE
jgi:hypothetical protein